MIRFFNRLFRVKTSPEPQVGDWWEVTGLEDLEGTMCKIRAISEQHVHMVCYTADGLTTYKHRTDRKMLAKFYERVQGEARAHGQVMIDKDACLSIRGNQVTCNRGIAGCGIQHSTTHKAIREALPEHTLTVYDHPEPHSHRWSDLELEAIKRYAEAYALQAVEALRPVAMTDAWHEGFSSGVRFAEAHHHHITQKENTP